MERREKVFKLAMARKKLTQKAIANELNVSQVAVHNFIRTLKKGGTPRMDVAQKYAEVLNIDVEQLI